MNNFIVDEYVATSLSSATRIYSRRKKQIMKKLLAIIVLIATLMLLVGCHEHTFSADWSSDVNEHWHGATCHLDEKSDVASHSWVATGSLDTNGNELYACSICGREHQHLYDAESWQFNGREHWHPVSCGHDDAPLFKEEHDVDADTGICSICSCDKSVTEGYEVAFAYYVVDNDGNPVVDADGYYTQVGVTYTNVNKEGAVSIDTVNGGVLMQGDVISFTVSKSVFCYYTDGAGAPLVESITGDGSGKNTREEILPDDDGVYTVTITGDTIISVANVETSPRTITGAGTQDDPYVINSEVDWLYFAMYVNDKSYYSIDYNLAYWKLNADLDFEGEVIYMIGDGYSSENSVFCGNFDGNGHTISNFVLENSLSSSVGEGYSNYVGLFGVMTGYVGVNSVISNLTVENVTVNATAGNDDIVTAGCILGYGVGSNVINCAVKNSQIIVNADDLYMSYAGGIVGYLQSGMTQEGILFYSSVSYSSADVDVGGTGMLYGAGGIAGRVVSYNDQVTSFIVNCYSSGSISDSVRAGGIAGELQRYGAIQNCYSTATVSAYSTYKSSVEEDFAGTVYDDRYSYAGGIVGYAENDTIVIGCFFDGNTYSTALSGNDFGKTGHIYAGFSAQGFADYYAKQTVLNNQSVGDVVDATYLKTQFNWNEADWVFGDGYPTINQQSAENKFTVTVNVDGENTYSYQIDSLYLPLSYWYVVNGSGGDQTIPRYFQEGTKRTYGYFFDADLTQPVPVGYVPVTNVTFYAKLVDASTIQGVYHLSGNGVSAQLTINDDGSYTYQEGAVLLNGTYKFDGQIITFENSFFSRLAGSATDTQKANYYTFWAKVQQNGNLEIFDCATRYDVTAETEEMNGNFTAMARFFPVSDPLVAILSDNVQFGGSYYYNDGAVKHLFQFNNDYTGSYKKYSGSSVTSDTFSFQPNGESIVIYLDTNGAQFTFTVENGVLASVTNNRGVDFELLQVDDFAGSWEKQATSHKTYTFDGMGSWSYQHYVYLITDNVVSATKQVVSQDNGSYSIDGNTITFTRYENQNGSTVAINVVATLVDGVIYVTENGQPVQVEFTGINGYKGVWYTASNKITRYTLTLGGLNSQGVGVATLDGFGAQPLELRYTAVSDETLYLYIEDVVYAILNYDAKTGIFNGLFYNSSTGSATTEQSLYLKDDFTGAWVSDIPAIPTIKFNGFGDYNTTDPTGNNLSIKGVATIGNDSVDYVLDRATGNAEFTYQGVKYVLAYNEYANTISVTYGSNVGVIAKADAYFQMILSDGQNAYQFDGRGHFAQGGVVLCNGESGIYKIQENGNVLLSFQGQQDQTIVVEQNDSFDTKYTLNNVILYVDNAFSGSWAIPTQNVSITVGNVTSIPANGKWVAVLGKYNSTDVTMYYNGQDVVTFEYNGKKYTLKNTLGGKASAMILTETVTVGTEVSTDYVVVKQDDLFGTWTRTSPSTSTLTFDGCSNSPYVNGGQVQLFGRLSSGHTGRVNYRYEIVDGVITLYDLSTNQVYATFEECEKDADGNYLDTTTAYSKDGKYYQLKLK